MAKKKEIAPVKVRKLRTNYELRYDYLPIITAFIKTLPKEHTSYRVDNVLDVNGGTVDEWVRIIREVQMGNMISFLVDNSIPFVFENLLPEELDKLRADYVERQNRISAALKLKEADLSFNDSDFNHMKIPPYDYQKQAVKFFEINEGKAILGDQPGVGKQAALDTLISTPDGWVEMGNIQVGEEIHDRFGGISTVTGVYPQGCKDSYKVFFNDGTSTKCGPEHLWKVRDVNRRRRGKDWTVKSLKELMDAGLCYNHNSNRAKSGRRPVLKWEIPVTQPVFHKKQNYFIDPYMLGGLLGDGYLCGKSAVGISVPDFQTEIAEKIRESLPEGYRLNKRTEMSCPQYMVVKNKDNKNIANEVVREIKKLGINIKSGKKFIPDIYLKGSIEQRISLLKGLMDTDGSVHKNRVHFHSTSRELSEGVVKLVQSLGGIAKINIYDRSKDNKPTEYRANIKTPFCPFYSSDKADIWSPKKSNYISKYISKVEYIGKEEQQCISVSCSDHTYLTDSYIVTHNTLPPITYAAKNKLKTLVVCPASLKLNWRKEILDFSNEKAHVYKYKPSKKTGKINYKKEESLFHIINYESIQTYIKLEYSHKCHGNIIVPGKGSQRCGMEIIDLTKKHTKCTDCKNSNSFKSRVKGIVFLQDKEGQHLDPDDYDLIVIDEFHRIKSVKTDWTRIIKRAFRDTVAKKILMSGTAIKSRPMEFFSGLNFMDPEMWNSFHDFGLRYCAAYETNFGWDYSGASNLEELFTRIAPYFLRRLKKDVLSQLPPKTYTEIEIELSSSQRSEYNKLLKEMKKVINEDGTEEEKEEGYLEKIHKLKQFTGSVKLDRMLKDGTVGDITSNGEKLVVMSDYQFLAETLHKEYKHHSVLHTGSMNQEDKQSSVDRFQEEKGINLFAGMIGASGVGITLTEASKLIFLGFAWSPADMEQAEDRIHRATTTHDNIQIIQYICVDTIDVDINDLLKEKSQVVSKVLDNKDYKKDIKVSNDSIFKSLIERLR